MRLEEGMQISALSWIDEGSVTVGEHGCTEIVVIMQYGQMAMVPWFKASYTDGTVDLHNAASVDTVQFLLH